MQILDLAEFRAPGARPRILPFWFWNGAMDEATVRLQVRQMHEGGCGGFFIHARQGMTLPYLSASWFARVRAAVEEAKALDMHAWLYDEYPYPSGIAGGLLTAQNAAFRAVVLENHTLEVPGESALRHEFPLGCVVSAVACRVENGRVLWDSALDIRKNFGVVLTREQFWRWPMPHIPYNEKRFMSDEGRLVLEWQAPPGAWRIFVALEKEQRGFKYYDYFFDPLVPGAADEFIRLTHERYAEELGEYFGNTIPGIFTDEIEPPAWSPEIEKAIGLDIALLLPALKHDDHPQAAQVRLAYRECALRLFQERWDAPVAAWCAQNNLIWTAEKPTWRPAQFLKIAQPATDAGHRRIGMPPEPLTAELRANHRAAMAAAEQTGTREVRCECFHSLGWGATLQDQKWAIDWLAVQGVNRFTPHAFYYTSAGLAKHDAAPSFFTETPAWKHFHLLGNYAARLGLALSTGREVARIALLHPTQSLWAGGESARGVRDEYEWLMNALLAEHHVFHPVDASVLPGAAVQNGALILGLARYETILVPPLSFADDETKNAVNFALQAGLNVLVSAENAADFPGAAVCENRAAWLDKLNQSRKLSISDENGAEIAAIWAAWRQTDTQNLLFVANTSENEVSAHVEVEIEAAWQIWSLEDGTNAPCEAQISGGKSRIDLQLPAFGSVLLVGEKSGADAAFQSSITGLEGGVSPAFPEGDWEIALDRPNALRLNRWRIACDESDWSQPSRDDSALREVPALPLRHLDQVARCWVSLVERGGDAPVWYRRKVTCDFVPEDLQILIENGAIHGQWTLFVNGAALPGEDYAPLEYNGSDKIAQRVAHLFRLGENMLALRVQHAPETGGLRTPLHLIGSFALGGAKRRTLTALPKTAPFNDLVAVGLSHFSGTALYRRRMNVSGDIELPRGFGDVAEVKLNGQSLGVRAWSPYRWAVLSHEEAEAGSEIEIAVTNTLLPFYEGQFWDTAHQKPRDV